MKRAIALAAALLFAAAGVFLLLLAVDVHRWQSRMAADDAAYRTKPATARLWNAPHILPAGVARGLLGVDDDRRIREALQVFKLGQPRKLFFVAGPDLISFRSAAQALLTEALDSETVPPRRSQELNLLGVLELISVGGGDPERRQQVLPRAAEAFRGAMASDPTNEDAKFNLELTLRLLQKDRQGAGAQSGTGGTTARGSDTGSGY